MHDHADDGLQDQVEWYWVEGGGRRGPASLDALHAEVRAGRVTPDTLVWCAGMPDWAEIIDVPDAWPHGVTSAATPAAPNPMATPLPGAFSPPTDRFGPVHPRPERPVEYVGFWMRFLAVIIDSIVLTCVGFGIATVAFLLMMVLGAAGSSSRNDAVAVAMVIIFFGSYALICIMPVLYYALMESSRHQATIGKLAIGARIVDARGHRISRARGFGRALSRLVSGMTFYIGFIIAGFDDRKRALHDLMAGTLVVRR